MRRKITLEQRQQMIEDRKRFKISHGNKGQKLSKERLEKLANSHRAVELGPPPKDFLKARSELEAKMLKAWRPRKQD